MTQAVHKHNQVRMGVVERLDKGLSRVDMGQDVPDVALCNLGPLNGYQRSTEFGSHTCQPLQTSRDGGCVEECGCAGQVLVGRGGWHICREAGVV